MPLRPRAAFLAALLAVGLVAAACGGGSSDSSSKATTTAPAAPGDTTPTTGATPSSVTPSIEQSCKDMVEIVGTALRLVFERDVTAKKQDTTKILDLLKIATNRAPPDIQAPMLVSAVYFKQVSDAVAPATDSKDYDARSRTIDRKDQDKAADLAILWFKKNCQ